MDFWGAQRRARKQTAIYLSLFVFLTLLIALFIEAALRYFTQGDYSPAWPVCGLTFLALTFIAALVHYVCLKACGGEYVAKSMGGRAADAASGLSEAQLLNIVNECAVASCLPVPKTYIIDADQINAFAAGLSSDDVVIAVTRGALQQLSRAEMQGVVAHEFGHIRNADTRIGLRLAAMLMGFYFIFYIALRLFEASARMSRSRSSRESERNPVLWVALVFILAGAIGWLFGSILKAAVSRQREYLADASSVQFTRNPKGLADALRKILHQTTKDMPKAGMAYSHLYLDDHHSFSSLLATHPPLKSRIEAIDPQAVEP
jgi:heat shock protein HtpX